MSSGGGAAAAALLPALPLTSALPPRRKPVTENWDDDFEFSIPVKAKSVPSPSVTPKREASGTSSGLGEGKVSNNIADSPDSFDEDWDAPSPTFPAPTSRPPPPKLTEVPRPHPPRSSASHSPTLPASAGAPWIGAHQPSTQQQQQPLTPSSSARDLRPLSTRSSVIFDRLGESSTPSTPRRTPVPTDEPQASRRRTQAQPQAQTQPQVQSQPQARRVPSFGIGTPSPQKARPSPLKTPLGTPSASPSPLRSPVPSPVRTPNGTIKPAPSIDNMREKRPSFWKRLSGGSRDSPERSPSRKRSSSVGAGLAHVHGDADEEVPPMPPLPANLRSPSTTSSIPSPRSQSSSKGKRMTATFLRRASGPTDSPSKPSAVPYHGTMKAMRSTSDTAARFPAPPRTPSPTKARSGSQSRAVSGQSRVFSPGFHLPSPSPGSPYFNLASPTTPNTPADEEKGRQRRPASAMPIPRRADGTVTPNGEEAPPSVHMPTLEALSGGMKRSTPPVDPRVQEFGTISREPATMSREPSSTSQEPARGNISDPPQEQRTVRRSFTGARRTPTETSTSDKHTSFAAQTQATLRRLTSFSKKHRRRLSNGWKIGNASGSGTGVSSGAASGTVSGADRPMSQYLTTVEGSPSKPSSFTDGESPKPTSTFPSEFELAHPPVKRRPKTMHLSAEPSTNTTHPRTPRERRPLSFSDFVIPDQVLAKQKELKRGIGAVKKFAGGVQSLKTLVAAHDAVCDNVLAMGSPEDMQLFVTLENEYTQWWEMATVLIEVGSTGTEEGAGTAPTVRTRRITLATDDARAASEAFETLSLSQRGPSYSTVKSVSTEASDVFSSDAEEDPRSKQDLSERQLEMLRTMLRTPVSASDSIVATVDERQALRARMRQSMPVAPTPREILPSGPATMRVNGINGGAALPPPPARPPRPVEPTYVVPSAYPSPETAAMLAQPRPRGLTGLRDFLRTLKSTGNKGADSRRAATAPSPVTPTPTPGAGAIYTGIGRHDIESPLPTPGLESGGNTMNTMRDSDGDSRAAPPMTLEAKKQRRRPSLKNIFRPGSGNWHELVRATPPGSPMPTLPMVGTMPTIPSPGQMVEDPDDEASGALTPSRLPRPPSIPAFPRKPYGTLTKHQQQRTDSPEPLPQTPPADDATLRLKSRVLGLGLGLGHPSEASPSRVNSSPARAAGPQTPNELLVPEEMPRSRSDIGPGGGAAQRDEEVIALTPENLPVLLDYVRQCEKRLQEWRVRAANLEKGGAGAMGMGAEE